MWLYHRVMSPNDAEGMANSVDPDQTAPLGAVWSGSALFAQACLSENLGSLRYSIIFKLIQINRLIIVEYCEYSLPLQLTWKSLKRVQIDFAKMLILNPLKCPKWGSEFSAQMSIAHWYNMAFQCYSDISNHIIKLLILNTRWAPSSEFVSFSIPSLQILIAHAQPFRGARDQAFCLKVPLDSLLA